MGSWGGGEFVKGPKTRWASSQLHLSAEYLMPRPCELWTMLVENNTVVNSSTGAAKTESSAAAALWQQQQIGRCYTGEKRPCAPMAQADFMGESPVVCTTAGCSRTSPVFVKSMSGRLYYNFYFQVINKRVKHESVLKGLKPRVWWNLGLKWGTERRPESSK